jgi:hypothetical protein
MKYAINSTGDWVVASANAAAERASTVADRRITSSALKTLSDAELVAYGVRNLDGQRPPTATQDYTTWTSTGITLSGDRARQNWVESDIGLEAAKTDAAGRVQRKLSSVAVEGATVTENAVDYLVDTSEISRTLYSSFGTYLAAGNTYVDTKFALERVSDGKKLRVALNAAQFAALTAAIATKDRAAMNNADALETAIDGAADVAALRAIDLEAGWPD